MFRTLVNDGKRLRLPQTFPDSEGSYSMRCDRQFLSRFYEFGHDGL
jgi:hypothetical protein